MNYERHWVYTSTYTHVKMIINIICKFLFVDYLNWSHITIITYLIIGNPMNESFNNTFLFGQPTNRHVLFKWRTCEWYTYFLHSHTYDMNLYYHGHVFHTSNNSKRECTSIQDLLTTIIMAKNVTLVLK